MAKKDKKTKKVKEAPVAPPLADFNVVFAQPQVAWRFKAHLTNITEGFSTLFCRNLAGIKIELVKKTVEVTVRETIDGDMLMVLHQAIRNECGLEIYGMTGTNVIGWKARLTSPKIIDHKSELNYGLYDVQHHIITWTFNTIELID